MTTSASRDSLPLLPNAREPVAAWRVHAKRGAILLGILGVLAALPLALRDPPAPGVSRARAVEPPPSARWSSSPTAPTVFDVSQLPRVDAEVIESPAGGKHGSGPARRRSPR